MDSGIFSKKIGVPCNFLSKSDLPTRALARAHTGVHRAEVPIEAAQR